MQTISKEEALENIKGQLKHGYIDFSGYEDGTELALIEEMVSTFENWNELKKWLEELQQEEFDISGFTVVCTEIRLECILDKMQELEGNNE